MGAYISGRVQPRVALRIRQGYVKGQGYMDESGGKNVRVFVRLGKE